MLRTILSHVRSHSVAYVALFFALSGTAIAAKAITGKQIRNNSVTGKDVRESSLQGVGAGVMMVRIHQPYEGMFFGFPVGVTASPPGDPGPIQMVSPSVDLKLRDLQVHLTGPPGAGGAGYSGVGLADFSNNISCYVHGTETSCSSPGPITIPAGSPLVAFTNVGIGATPSDALISYRLTP
jgi:hypothetical protein